MRRDHRIYGDDETLDKLEDEYRNYVGRDTRREPGVLIILSQPRRKKKQTKEEISRERWSKREREYGTARE